MKARIKRVVINPLAFVSIVQDDSAWRVTAGIPKGANLHGATLDPLTMNFVLFIEHESFDEVDVENDVAPLFTIEIRRVQ